MNPILSYCIYAQVYQNTPEVHVYYIYCSCTFFCFSNQLMSFVCLFGLVGYPMKACTDSFFGTRSQLLEEEVLKKVDLYEGMLVKIAEKYREERVSCSYLSTAVHCSTIYKFPTTSASACMSVLMRIWLVLSVFFFYFLQSHIWSIFLLKVSCILYSSV